MLLEEGLLMAAGVALASAWGLFLSALLKDRRICEAEQLYPVSSSPDQHLSGFWVLSNSLAGTWGCGGGGTGSCTQLSALAQEPAQ